MTGISKIQKEVLYYCEGKQNKQSTAANERARKYIIQYQKKHTIKMEDETQQQEDKKAICGRLTDLTLDITILCRMAYDKGYERGYKRGIITAQKGV